MIHYCQKNSIIKSERMSRRTLMRMAGITGAAVFAGKSLGEPRDALAGAGSRFDATLRLTSAGTVIASGPTGFDADEARMRIWAHVAQAGRVQSGATDWFPADSKTWATVLTGPALKPGPADAYGVAYVQNRDGSFEWYPWEVAVTLR